MSAVLSDCGTYRYVLTREWASPYQGRVLFIMLNPSTADATSDDPTICRCISYAKDWMFDGLIVCNLFALRATDSKELYKARDPVGPDNDFHIERQIDEADIVVCGWGNPGLYLGRSAEVVKLLRKHQVRPHCLIVTKQNQPGHPLYLKKSLEPIRWAPK